MNAIVIYYICICKVNYEATSAIANIILAIVTVAALVFSIYQNWQLRKQKFEDERARLSISIIERDGHYQLRISNVGYHTAYNIKLTFNKDFIEILNKNYLLGWENIQAKPFNLEKGNSLYLDILPIIRYEELRFIHNFDVSTLKSKGHHNLAWLKEYGHKKIYISGTYNDAYKIKEDFSVLDYIILGVDKDENPIVDALNNIGNRIGYGRSNSLNDQLRPVSEYFRKENMSRKLYGNRMPMYSPCPIQKPKDESLWTLIINFLKNKFK